MVNWMGRHIDTTSVHSNWAVSMEHVQVYNLSMPALPVSDVV
ncbi:hypothetical protein ACWOBE_04580 [Hutsoniella sourekii]